MSNAATTAAIVGSMAAAERRIVRVFVDQEATAPERAVPFQPRRGMETNRFRHLLSREVLVEAEPGLFHLDEDAWRGLGSRRRRTMVWVLAAVVVVLLAVLLLSGAR